MRGFPLLNALGILAILLGAWFPLSRMTQPTPAKDAPGNAPLAAIATGPEISVAFSLRFAHPPLHLKVSHLGDTLWETNDATQMVEGLEAAFALPPEGVDLLLEAEWPPGTPLTALELTLEPEMMESQSAVVWGEGLLEEVLTFVWEEQDA